MAAIFLSGSGWFGQHTAEELVEAGHALTGVSAPVEGRRTRRDLLASWAERADVPYTDADNLTPDHVPDGTDIILTAHSHAFIGVRTRACARWAFGYHPSMLPLHRGRDAVRWQALGHERVVGGTIYHLTNRVDAGPIALQEAVVVPDGIDTSSLWRGYLAPLGLRLILDAVQQAEAGTLPSIPQDDRLATWEPSFDAKPLYRPELLELPPGV